MPRCQDHVRLDYRPPYWIAFPDHGAFDDRRVLDQGALDLEGADAVAGRDDHVVRSSDKPEVALGVHVGSITGHIPIPALRGFGGGRVAPVLLEEAHRAPRPR